MLKLIGMTAETLEEFKGHLADNYSIFKIRWDGRRPLYENPEAKCIEIPFPKAAGEFAHLATRLPTLSPMDAAEWDGGALVYTDWGIWDQSASLAGYQMVERIRSTFGEHRPFNVATVNRFRADEQPLLANFILAALIYGWDAYYFPNYGGCFAHISHDEWCCIVTESNEDFKNVAEPHLKDPDGGCRVLENWPSPRPALNPL
ncbi:MAG TPA: hypothetical protein VGT04_09550 [Acidobacteriaceae bacterium]|nr:hypothetical protein [Acidobacteriaceae bacterium]